jgi:hypothetical protein
MRPDAVFLLGAILDWVILCFLLSIMLFLACVRVRLLSPFERDRARGFTDRAWLDQLSLYFITHGTSVSLLVQVHSRLVYLMGMRVQPSIAVSVLSHPPQSLAPRRPPRFSERSAAHRARRLITRPVPSLHALSRLESVS